MKKVKVLSHTGEVANSNATSSSGCYVNIPSAYDIDSSQTLYTGELYNYPDNQTINFMAANSNATAASMRIRSYSDGTAGDYWLRSPDIRYTSYQLYVDSDGGSNGSGAGNINSFIGTNSELGVLIEISF